jgi:hypothetical protein
MPRFRLTALLLVRDLGFWSLSSVGAEAVDELRVATFRYDVAPPLGQPMFSYDAIRTVEDTLLAKCPKYGGSFPCKSLSMIEIRYRVGGSS